MRSKDKLDMGKVSSTVSKMVRRGVKAEWLGWVGSIGGKFFWDIKETWFGAETSGVVLWGGTKKRNSGGKRWWWWR